MCSPNDNSLAVYHISQPGPALAADSVLAVQGVLRAIRRMVPADCRQPTSLRVADRSETTGALSVRAVCGRSKAQLKFTWPWPA